MNSAVELDRYKTRSRHTWRALTLLGLGVTLLLLATVATLRFHWHERAWYYVSSRLEASQWAGRSVWLPDYRADIQARPVADIDDDLSAIDFAADRQHLLAVTNAPPIKLLEMDREGKVLASYPLEGFEDVEGLAYMGDSLVALTDEVQQQLVFFRLPGQAGQRIDKRSAQTLALPLASSAHNKGFEGVAYDAAHDRLFVAKERDPRSLYAVSGIRASLDGRLQLKVEDLSDWVERSVFARDISDLHFDAPTGHLLVLSHESKLVIELGEHGELVSFRTLLGHLGDLDDSVGQAEGLTLDDQRVLYVVGEPNLFYRFRKN
ncbi:SdiA-regulated domain-containing protein [Pseudomonas sp. Q1-7]|uniref:SdiA-regulated domain-containing protein n=1 Tax=Pseudomonas sp. Q1-7 TaxID=3020843 RepID=UPI0022FFE1E9|nr:SdiA-regulated domain-containing protein [Pseudomonas sp. Q1-7]